MNINVYLNFNGTTEEAFNFYKSVFGGEFTTVQRFSDVQGTDHLNAEEKNKLMHISLPVGSSVLMGTDAFESMGHKITEGTNFNLSVEYKTEAEADKIFAALSAGGKVTMAMEKTFWGAYFGMLVDKFGIQWMVSTEHKS